MEKKNNIFFDFAIKYDIIIFGTLLPVWGIFKPEYLPLLLILPFILILYIKYDNVGFPITTQNIPFLGLLVLTLLSIIKQSNYLIGYPKIIGICLGVIFYFILLKFGIHGRKKQTILILGFVSLGFFWAFLGIFGADDFDKYKLIAWISEKIPQLFNIPGKDIGFHPNGISGALTLITPLSLICYFEKRYLINLLKINNNQLLSNLFSIGLFLAVATQLLWWIISQSRGGLIGLFTGVLFIVLRNLKKMNIWFSIIIPIFISFTFIIVLFNSKTIVVNSNIIDYYPSLTNNIYGNSLSGSLNARLCIWEGSLKLLNNSFLIGFGVDSIPQLIEEYLPCSLPYTINHAHNIWLNIALTFGIIGLIILIWIWVRNFLNLILISNSLNNFDSNVAIGLLAGWISFFIFGISDTVPLGTKHSLNFFFSLALTQLLVFYNPRIRR